MHKHTQVEEWRDIPGYESKYQVSDHGRVRSLDRIITTKAGVRRYKGKMLTLATNESGHLQANLGRIGGTKQIHSLVLEAFVGPAPKGHECRHLDGNPANNHLDNLRWGTKSENNYDRVRHGTHHNTTKTHCPRGHALESPNLDRANLKLGWRTCLACARAHSHVNYHQHLKSNFQQIADRNYQEIMSA